MDTDQRYPPPPFDEPDPHRFVYGGWSVDPPRLPRVGRSTRRQQILERLSELAAEGEQDPSVAGVAVFETRLIAPIPGTPRLDVLVLARASDDTGAAGLADALGADGAKPSSPEVLDRLPQAPGA